MMPLKSLFKRKLEIPRIEDIRERTANALLKKALSEAESQNKSIELDLKYVIRGIKRKADSGENIFICGLGGFANPKIHPKNITYIQEVLQDIGYQVECGDLSSDNYNSAWLFEVTW